MQVRPKGRGIVPAQSGKEGVRRAGAVDGQGTGEVGDVDVAGDEVGHQLSKGQGVFVRRAVRFNRKGIGLGQRRRRKGFHSLPDEGFHPLPKFRSRLGLAIGNEPKAVVFQVFDDEKIVEDPFHLGQGRLRCMPRNDALRLHAVVIGDVADSSRCQGQVAVIFLVMPG